MSAAYWFARGGSTLAGWTPRKLRHTLGGLLGTSSYLGWRAKRLVTLQNMAQVAGLPVKDPRVQYLAYASWKNYGRYAADFLNFPNLNLEYIEEHLHDLSDGGRGWLEEVQLAQERGKGVIFATAHFGNWDIAGAIVGKRMPLSVVVESFDDPRMDELIQGQRRDKGMTVIPMESSMRRILRTLQQNQIVAIVADRPVSAEQGVPVTFCGRTTYVPGGPAALALKSGAAIVPGYVWYGEKEGYLLRAFPPIIPREYKGNEEKTAEIARLTQEMYNAQEAMVRSWPTQWYMFRAFWPQALPAQK
ncbi:MAG TPA: lysophospholipid acyltransferase family protein [Ktedonobacteraceae bacterium]|nr:lysophospholipid acyltransferase family protein [Ktedonobacteraceae bacterium]